MSAPSEPWSDADRLILEARTRALAAPPAAAERGTLSSILLLRVGGERYGIPAEAVQAVAALLRLSPLPHAPPEVAGLTARGGQILPVFHLRAVLGLSLAALPEYGRIVLLGEGREQLALVVDAVEGMKAVDVSTLKPAPATLSAPAFALVLGVDDEGVPLLDPAALLASDRLFIDIAPPAA
jgi:chemotaxis signal transduction protein